MQLDLVGAGELDFLEVAVGDELLVRSSEILPVDGVLISDHATIDESSVTGEPIPASTMRATRCFLAR